MSDSTNSEVKKNNSAPVPDHQSIFNILFHYIILFYCEVMVGDGGKWDKILLTAYVCSINL